ncbi:MULTISPECIES: glutamate synthase large subunit [unclassified Streptomyces]|uniref:Glutamate synthase large subunit n=1 Tax=Streptomyces sp. gb1(2016) TaxID=1828321 RepID=A0A652KM78_9ACTN|nr:MULTISPECIES: glutamate synthase large subunit [unclassified Streptomyces]WSS61269.1 glutamate synthase large subunit [Streptomyces sp. NBC_01177]WSS68313.1 glutamate synthase large subunit [Streptomyces sp. NBC_01175]WSS75311.1 glutamate synthase large subunit [Streptomyces sp. NBC_01174]RPK42454.1 Glutamate synthase [NADPH] large chain [Streptomyces sp. ADI93-02]TXS24793.1 glutamate synthase large subunit [Streptomyces sp. gb1(2016)]
MRSDAWSPMDGRPVQQGMYDPRNEHDACGVGFVATLTGVASHELVEQALTVLRNLEHRGATGSEPDSGDGAGILLQVPDAFLREEAGFELPEAGSYAVGIAFLPADDSTDSVKQIEKIAAEEGLDVLGWRQVPVTPDILGSGARATMPEFRQLIVADGESTGIVLDRKAFVLRKRAEREAGVYFPSLSARTIVYKGMLTTGQLEPFFPDLSDRRFATAVALVHSRFSTNTFPSWPLAHPYRFVAHNGEINTVKGNRNWMKARESQLASSLFGEAQLDRIFPVCTPDASDSASFDEVLELLHLGGRSLPHSVLMMVPEAWENHASMDPARRAFYQYHSTMMEPWDGPACVTFTDGVQVGAVLDRNGLRPGRYWVTDDGLVVLSSEVGVLDIDPAKVVRKGRLQPGRMFLVDTAEHRIIEDDEIKASLAAENPYQEWLETGEIELEDLPEREHIVHTHASVTRRQQTFGYTEEELRVLLAPMARTAGEPLGSMGTDSPIAALSERPRLLFDYFTQLFAQVTNPPLDAIREELVTSLRSTLGPQGNILEPTAAACRAVTLPFPVIDNDELAKLIHINADGDMPGMKAATLSGLYRVSGGGDALAARIEQITAEVDAAIEDGARLIVLSDRHSDAEHAPIPSLLLTSAVHHHLIRTKQRTQVGLLVEAGDVREVHHVALLIGYGAAAVNPYLAMESVEDLVRAGTFIEGIEPELAIRNLIYALGKGVLKVMSKMGISTVASYRGAQVFEAVGLDEAFVAQYFNGTATKIGGAGLDVVAKEVAARHTKAYPASGISASHRALEIGGEYQWRREGEPHLFDPETVFRLQHATRNRRYDIFKKYTGRVNEQSERLMTLRGLFGFKSGREPISIDEVESAAEIVKRFSTGAMSYGSISQEAHETLAIAMNQLGGKSNTGEGGEDSERLYDPARRSSIKQVASGRFGVTSEYLVNADDIQIKMAQGAKPGEGGQLPGHKVYPWVAKTRHSTPGVGLISPPPHHDIYSIEDLAQLIHDLKNANPAARVHVKLVSEVGVGTVAAGVSKAHADVVLISGHDGGTGASPLTSLKHAGGPWELGLAETQQTLLLNGLRDRIVVQTDGQLKTGRDVVIAALLGAEEFGFATAPLVVSGCVMMRVCHLDTCPVGIATQNPVLRERFSGKAEYIVNFFEFIAEEVREILAELGFRTIEEAVGHAELLDTERAVTHWKAQGLDLEPLFYVPELPEGAVRHRVNDQDHGLTKALDNELIKLAADALGADSAEAAQPVRAQIAIRNINRTVGTMLGHEVTKKFGGAGLPDDTIDITFTGSAGQSFGAFVPRGVTLRLEGDANDYVGKGLSGGRVIVRPDRGADHLAEYSTIAGNTIGYGATGGELFLRGRTGERFCVRNSGATVVSEGVGDHGCEYMTGGHAVVLGETGRNFAAGMSGGIAYVIDLDLDNVNTGNVGAVELLDDTDRQWLHDVVRRHQEETGSTVAEKLLADWDSAVTRFSKIIPSTYKAVLAAKDAAELAGLSEQETTEKMMEAATNG